MNTTDQQKQAILAMFQQPIEEVEVAFKEVNEALSDLDKFIPFEFFMAFGGAFATLGKNIRALKSALPTVQEDTK